METNTFILALSKTLPESCLQGLVVYLILQLLFLGSKKSTPSLKFNFYYAANLFLFLGFLYTFFHHYQQVQVTSFNPDLLPNKIGSNVQTVTIKPNLWLQFSFWTYNYAHLITGLYLIGLLFYMLKLIIGIINISWFKNNKNLKLDDYLTKISIQLSSNFRLIKTVPVYLSDQIFVPLTIGFIKPMIVFPIALINQLSAEQTEAILLHELAHIKRKDYLLNILLCIVQSFLFFNPAIWLMKREINKYREQCCDDLVLDNTQHKIAYARALLLIEASRSIQLSLALASNGKKYTLLNRIKRITNMKTNEPSPQNKLVLLLLALIVVGLTVAWNMPVKKVVKPSTYAAKRSTYTLYHVKTTGMNPNAPYAEWSADTMMLIRKSKQSPFVAYTNNIVFKPNKKYNKKFTFSGDRISVNEFADTVIKSKNKFKIVLEDSTGNKKEYNSIEELPAEEQKEFLKENRKLGAISTLMKIPTLDMKLRSIREMDDSSRLAYVDKFKSSPELKKQMEDMRKQFNSPQWKKQAELMRKQGEDMRKQFSSPEWKATMKKLQEESAAIGEQARKQFDTPEFRLKMEKLREESKAMGEQARKQFDTPEFKKQMENYRVQAFQNKTLSEEMRKYYQSPEWKKQQKKIKTEIEKSQKEWRKSMDIYRKPALPEKTITPQY